MPHGKQVYRDTPSPESPGVTPPTPPHCPKQKANSSLFTSIGYMYTYWQFEFCIHSMTCMQLATLVLFYKGDNL